MKKKGIGFGVVGLYAGRHDAGSVCSRAAAGADRVAVDYARDRRSLSMGFSMESC